MSQLCRSRDVEVNTCHKLRIRRATIKLLDVLIKLIGLNKTSKTQVQSSDLFVWYKLNNTDWIQINIVWYTFKLYFIRVVNYTFWHVFLWWERQNSATVVHSWKTLTAKLCCLEGLAILLSKALVFLSRIGSVGWVWYAWCFVIRWCCGGGVSSILAFCREALPTLRYFPKDTKLALDMTLLRESHYILQVFCVCQDDGGGVNRGS